MRKRGSIKTKASHSTYTSTRELSRKGGSMEPQEPPLDPPLLGCLSSYGLDPIDLSGQAYDGAGNVTGSVNGTATLITHSTLLHRISIALLNYLNLAVVIVMSD